jgi:glycosyltransferase involved in cell wall biosynthesis
MTNDRHHARPLVSVVMAVLNPHPVYFPQAVASILGQTLDQLELIIVEEPSPCCGRAFVESLNDPRVRYCGHPQRTSLVAQRNRALARARGEFLAVLDADDVAEPTRLQRQVDYLRAHPDVGVVGSQVRVIDGDSNPAGYRSFPLDHDTILRALRDSVAVCQGSAMFRTAVVREVGGYQFSEQDTVEDYDLFCRLAAHGVRFANLPQPLLNYRFHPGQMKATRLRATIRGILAVKHRYWNSRMPVLSRLRMCGERLVLLLPSRMAQNLLMWTHYRDRPPIDPLPRFHTVKAMGGSPAGLAVEATTGEAPVATGSIALCRSTNLA